MKSIASIAQDIPCIIMNGLTKNYFLPGWQIGYMCFYDPEEKISQLRAKVNKFSRFIQLIPTPIRAAAIAALQGPLDHLYKALPELEKRRDYTWKRLSEIDGVTCTKPQGGYFVFPHVQAIGKLWKDDEAFLRDLVNEEHLWFRPGSLFGEGCLRYFRSHFLNSIELLSDIYDRLESFLNRHR